jgi:gluconate 2-dehydrogenase
MLKPKVFIAEKVPEKVEKYIGEFCDYEKWEKDELISKDELIERLKDKEGVLLSRVKIDKEVLKNAPKLKVVSNVTVGYNNFDLEAMKERGIVGTNTAGALDDTVSDLIFGMILSVARRIPELDKYVKDGNWTSSEDKNFFGLDVHHSTIGIIGMGRIGETVAKRAKYGFDMEVLYHNRTRKYDAEEKMGVQYCELKTLLEKSDFIILMTPLTKETYHLIDSEAFGLMKETAIFINASRGQTVNELAMIEALQNKKIFGAGLDVYEVEPMKKENPLLKMSNVVSMPHIGSATEKTRFNMAMKAAECLVKTLSGEVVSNIVPELVK